MRDAPTGSAVAAVILAAGRSSRMGPRHKLLMRDAAGRTMIARVVEAALASRASEVVVVTGHEAARVAQAARGAAGEGSRLRIVSAPNYAEGLSASLKTGIAALPDAAAVLVCLGDMPLVTAAMLDALIAAFEARGRETIVVPTCRGRRGNPVLWGRAFFGAFATLAGDTGARALLAQHAGCVTEIELGDEAVLRDFDTPDACGENWRDPSP